MNKPMGVRLYRATGVGVTALTKVLGIRLRVSGAERLPDAPALFIVNHFTRFETFLIPYAIYHRFGRTVHSLATHALFHGLFGKYFESIGVVSVRDPLRNRRIVAELMTGRSDWVVYPEGGLVKSKRTTLRRRALGRENRIRRPRTGAALMALRSELFKRRYLEACQTGNRRLALHYESRYDVTGPGDLAPRSTMVVPVTITYPRLRAGPNPLNRLARLLAGGVDPMLDEELQVEGTLLFSDASMNVHFGEPIPVSTYLEPRSGIMRRVTGLLGESRRTDALLRRQAWRLTSASMSRLYESTEVNFDHLFCYGLRAVRRDEIPVRQFHEALYLAAMELRGRDDVRLHPVLRNGIAALATNAAFEPLADVEALACREGVLRRESGRYVINRPSLTQEHERHEIRLRKMVQVIANELEPVAAVRDVVRTAVNLGSGALRARLPKAILASDLASFRREYAVWHDPGVTRPEIHGAPFLLEAPRARAGIVLVHGYLACPGQVRPLAGPLHARGYTVYGVRLDGHGTSPRHLNAVTWRVWLETVAQAHTALRATHERTFVVGFSLGGVIALLLAAELGDGLDGVVSISAPLKLRNRLAALVPAAVGANAALRRVQPWRDHSRRANVSESPDLNYATDYLRGTRELRRAMHAARACLSRVTAPALVIQADRDPIVHPASAERILHGLASGVKHGETIRAARHAIVRGDHAPEVLDLVQRFVESLDG